MTSANSQHSSEQREPEKKIKSIIKKKEKKNTCVSVEGASEQWNEVSWCETQNATVASSPQLSQGQINQPARICLLLKCHHLLRSFANTQTGTCSRIGGANFMNACIISPTLQHCSPVLQGSLQPPDFDGELFINSFVWAVLCFVLHYCTLQCVPTVFPTEWQLSPYIWMWSWMCLGLQMVSAVLQQFVVGGESQLWLWQRTEEG